MPDISQEELDKLKAAQKSAEALEAKNKELLEEKKREKEAREAAEKKAKDAEDAVLKEKGDYKTLAEKYEKAEKDRENEKKADQEKLEKGAKLSKVKDELLKLGIKQERIEMAMRLVDLSDVKYDAATNTVYAADLPAVKLKTAMPEIFGKSNSEEMGGGAGGNGNPPSKMSPEDFAKLSPEERKKQRADYLKSQNISL